MEKICIEMPVVAGCSATECAYNLDQACQARAISVGDGIHPGCDTYMKSSQHAKSGMGSAGIGACKVAGCKFNEGLECMSENIMVGHVQNQVNCMTFAAR